MKTFIFALILGAVLGRWIERNAARTDSGEGHGCPLPTRCELQRALGVEVDGDIGPETIMAWDKYESDMFAELVFGEE